MVVTDPSARGSINDPTGCFWRTRSFENKHEEEGVVNWRLLPADIDLRQEASCLSGYLRVAKRSATGWISPAVVATWYRLSLG